MWPFLKKPTLPQPDDVISGNDRARFDSQLDQWEFEMEGMEFTLSGRDFDPLAFQWARVAVHDIQRLQSEIDRRVLEQLEGWPCDAGTRKLLCVGLDDYATDRQIDLTYIGDDSWGDYGVTVILADGRIIDAYGGD